MPKILTADPGISLLDLVKQHLEREGFEPEEIEHFVTQMEVPPTAKGLWTVATRFVREILPNISASTMPQARRLTSDLGPIAKALEQAANAFPERPDFRNQPLAGKARAKPGFLSQFPLYGSLWASCDFPELTARYACLRAHFMIGYLQIKPHLELRPHVLQIAGMHFRRIGSAIIASAEAGSMSEVIEMRPTLSSGILAKLPSTWTDQRQYGTQLLKLTETISLSGEHPDEVTALQYVADVILFKFPDARSGSSSQRTAGLSKASQTWFGFGELLSLPRNSTTDADVIIVDHVGSDHEPEHLAGLTSGLDDEDFREVDTETRVRMAKGVLTTEHDRLTHIGNSNLADVVALSNQMFPFSKAQCSTDDIRVLLPILTRDRSNDLDIERVETVTLLLFSLLTGQALAQCHRAILGTTTDTSQITVDMKLETFMFLPWRPKGHELATSQLSLPIAGVLRNLLCLLISRNGVQDGERIYKVGEATLTKRAKEALKRINEATGASLSISSISSLLYRTISQSCGGDESPAIILTGAENHCGYVAATYSKWSSDALREIYLRAISQILANADLSSNIADQKRLSISFFGSALVPKEGEIKNFVAKMISTVRATQHLPPRRPGVFETHIAYTIYVYSMLSFATGWRPSLSPLPDLRLVDVTTGFAMLSDKDTNDGYHAHLVWLPPVCIMQIEHYSAHLKMLAERLAVISPSTPEALLRSESVPLSKNRTENRSAWADDPRFLFGVHPNGDRYPIPPALIQSSWKSHSGPVKNGQRHFLRTELTRKGVSDEVTRAVLGHWRIGEEVFGKFSGMDPHAIRHQLQDVLPNLMSSLGWVALKSPFWKQ